MRIHQSIDNERNPVGNTNELFVNHHTGSMAPDINQRNFLNREDYISVHYSCDRNGKLWQMMGEEYIAYHCGVSSWKNFTVTNKLVVNPHTGEKFTLSGLNPVSSGVEINSDGLSFTDAQRNAILKLNVYWCFKNNRNADRCVTHEMIAPTRKWDVGPNFYKEKWGSWEGFQKAVQFELDLVRKHFNDESEFLDITYIKK